MDIDKLLHPLVIACLVTAGLAWSAAMVTIGLLIQMSRQRQQQ